MADADVHEIQLNGKQLVFLFMAATVVAVVIFLCGVMVGRGVRARQADTLAAAAAAEPIDPTDAGVAADDTPIPSVSGGDDIPQTAKEPFSYGERLASATPVKETLSPATPGGIAEDVPPPVEEVAPEMASTTPTTGAAAAPPAGADGAGATAATVTAEPAGPGFVVQVAAVRPRADAEAMARRLAAKGYPAFVTTPSGGPRVFRVRVGKYKDRREAEAVATRLQKEEQFKPWITR